MAVWFDHADSFKLDHFDQNFHLIFWLKVKNNTVFEASILEYDRYEPPLGARFYIWPVYRVGFYLKGVTIFILLHI